MKTISLSISKKIADLGVNVESDLVYIKTEQVRRAGELLGRNYLPAYTLQDLPDVLRAIGEKRGWIEDATAPDFIEDALSEKLCGGTFELVGPDLKTPITTHHFLKICRLFAETGELGEGSAVEKYLMELL
jgi:hypothetical protein